MTIERFEDLIAWQKARALTREIYAVTRSEEFRRDFALASQIQRSAVSAMANLAEGFERRRRTVSFRYVEMAKGSCAEVASHLYVALDAGYIAQPDFDHLMALATELQRILGGLKSSLAPVGPRASGLGTRP